jgi:hypothetical protein
MNKVTFPLARLAAMPRPASYVQELTACAVARTDDTLTFDQDSPCYQALKAKYSGYQPTPEELARAQKYDAQQAVERQAMVQQNQAVVGTTQTNRAAKSGCGGCQGRKIQS